MLRPSLSSRRDLRLLRRMDYSIIIILYFLPRVGSGYVVWGLVWFPIVYNSLCSFIESCQQIIWILSR
ncbi:unnamed protein product [Tenebrio molitor]|nr:unnamed protein product [Tenebrio molitor]